MKKTCFNCRDSGHPQSNCTKTICKTCGLYGIHDGYDNKPGVYCDMAAAKLSILLNSARPRTQSRSRSRNRNNTPQEKDRKNYNQQKLDLAQTGGAQEEHPETEETQKTRWKKHNK